MFEYQKTGIYYARIAEGLEEAGGDELVRLGAKSVKPEFRGIRFGADPETFYAIHYRTRLVSRILAPLITFDCHSDKYLYKTGRTIDWPGLFETRHTFAIDANVSNSNIRHSHYAAQKLKDAIADRFIEERDERPSVDRQNPDVRLHLHIHANRARISLDTSGGSLHRRGYRQETVEAPMQETLAAAIVLFSGWEGEAPLFDPMCGSGTLLCEALMRYSRIPAGFLRRRFGFRFLPDFDRSLWDRIRNGADGAIRRPAEGLIEGGDRSRQAAGISRSNCRILPGGETIRISAVSFQDHPGWENGVILSNPPYGIRSGDKRAAGELVKELGDFLKNRCRGSNAYLYFGDRELLKRVGLRPAWKKALRSGGLDGRLAKYEMY